MVEMQAQLGIPSVPQQSPDYREVYANNVRVAITPFDVLLHLGRSTESNGASIIEEDISLRLSPHFCKTLASHLTKALVAWESQFGEIQLSTKTPQEVLAAIQSAIEQKKL